MEEQITKAVFCRKAINMQELKEVSGYGERAGTSFQVSKAIELTPEQFREFGEELYEYYHFLYDFRSEMFYDMKSQTFQCILVTTPERKEGILIQAEGYAYARYSAYISDCKRIDLSETETVRDASMSHEIPGDYWRIGVYADHVKERREER